MQNTAKSARTCRAKRWFTTPLLSLVALALLGTACTDDSGRASRTEVSALRLTAVSTRADSVSGGDVLVELTGIPSGSTGAPTITVDGKPRDVTFTDGAGFASGKKLGLVTDLPEGSSKIEAKAGQATASLSVTNHPIDGPIFSGPHLPLTKCVTTDFGLAEAQPPLCDAPAKVSYRYVDGAGKFHPLPDPTQVPPDAATVTVDGTTLPFVVRDEHGVINRGVYEISAFDPSPTTSATAWDPSHWNRRLIFRFGGGCGTLYTQGANLLDAPDPDELKAGYATATSTFDTFQVHCNDVISAETAMMVKEHFTETYGVPDLTIGEGGSGGAIQQLLIAQNYPGILDALGVTVPFPDAVSISGGVVDCALLNRFYRSEAGSSWTDAQRVAVNGHLTTRTCDMWESTFVGVIDPSSCGLGAIGGGATKALPGLEHGLPVVDQSLVYDPATNPKGIRCTLQDSMVNVVGRDPATGFARRPWDNVGIQYGLSALRDGTITADQFLDLNAELGSFDIDGKPQASRARADEDSLKIAYRSGRVNEGGGDLQHIPIVAVNVYTDPMGDIHDRYRAFTIRERLAGDDGTTPNLAVWTRPLPEGATLINSLTGAIRLGASVAKVLDEWATRLHEDSSSRSRSAKLAAARPELGVDACFTAEGDVVAKGDGIYDRPGPCTDPYPVKGDPRTVAGSPQREDVLACDLEPVAAALDGDIYEGVTFTDAQRERLAEVFPDGVCDWTKPGRGRVELGKPWQHF